MDGAKRNRVSALRTLRRADAAYCSDNYKIKVNNVNNLTIKTQIKRLIKNAQIYLQGVTFRNFVSYNVPIRNDMNYKEGLIYET